MLRKRSRPAQNQGRPQPMAADSAAASSFPFFKVPNLLVGLCTKGSSDSESVRSPTSPLECRAFSNLGSSLVKSPRSPSHPMGWDCSRVGLGLVDSLKDDVLKPGGGVSVSKSVLFGPQMKISIPIPKSHLDAVGDDQSELVPKSLPKDFGISRFASSACPRLDCGEVGGAHANSVNVRRSSAMPLSKLLYHNLKSSSEGFSSNSKDSPRGGGGNVIDDIWGSLPISMSSTRRLMGSLTREIDLPEDYTCIMTHGPNPKTTHILGDWVLETSTVPSANCKSKNADELVKCCGDSPTVPSDALLHFCFSCKNKLDSDGAHIYRGEKAFCSCACLDQEILIEEESQKPATDSPRLSFDEEIFLDEVA